MNGNRNVFLECDVKGFPDHSAKLLVGVIKRQRPHRKTDLLVDPVTAIIPYRRKNFVNGFFDQARIKRLDHALGIGTVSKKLEKKILRLIAWRWRRRNNIYRLPRGTFKIPFCSEKHPFV